MWLYFPLKRREFDGFLGFLTGSCEGAYFAVRNWAGFRQNAEKARIIAVLQKKFRQSPRLLTSQAPRNNQ